MNDKAMEKRAQAFLVGRHGEPDNRVIANATQQMESIAIECAAFAASELAAARERIAELTDVLTAWRAWFEGPYVEGISYINPPLKATDAALTAREEEEEE